QQDSSGITETSQKHNRHSSQPASLFYTRTEQNLPFIETIKQNKNSEVDADSGTNCSVIKEAENVCATCEQVCHYVPSVSPHVKCGCYRGYAIAQDWQHCIDIDECSINPLLCHGGTCLNTVGSFLCRCRPGYQLVGHVCVDIDECDRNRQICQQTCINTPGSYQCWCEEGFTPSHTNPALCVDIDECKSGVCSHNCTNTLGSFTCSCPHNMMLHADGRTCKLDVTSRDIVIDGQQKIVIYGNNSAARTYSDLWTGVQLESERASGKEEGGLANTSAAFSPEIVTMKLPPGRYKACVPACKNGGICDGRGKCHCRSGFQGRYCQMDINECSVTPSVCSFMCVNMFGSYQCICPQGYNSSADRKSCFLEHHNYSAVIQVVVSPKQSLTKHQMEPPGTFSNRVRYHRSKPHNQLAIENLHTMISSSLENEPPVVEVKPTAALQRDVTVMPTASEYIAISQTPIAEFHRSEHLIMPTFIDQDTVVPTMWNSLNEDTGRILDTLFSFILGTDEVYIETSRRRYFEPTSSVMVEGSKISASASESAVSEIIPTVSLASNILLMTRDGLKFENETGSAKGNRDQLKKDKKGKVKKMKKLEQKNRKEKKLKNKTLRKGRIKLVRLTKDFQVLHQILDASRESWRTDGSTVQRRTQTDWDDGMIQEDRKAKSYEDPEDQYFEVIDYDEEDSLVPASLSLSTNQLPVLNMSRTPEADCTYKNQVIKSHSSMYQDDTNCTRCLCKSGRAVCEDVHCRQVDCPHQQQVYVPDECCPTCQPSEPGCLYKGHFFYQGQLWVRKEGGCQALSLQGWRGAV
ncbi:hypothetical protein L9F63_023385, partial [Diploptera punctata]